MTFEERIVEAMAEQAHKSWAGWMKWQFEKGGQIHHSGETFLERWTRQMNTPYAELSEREKESDRDEAKEWLAAYGSIIKKLIEEDFEVAKKAVHVDS